MELPPTEAGAEAQSPSQWGVTCVTCGEGGGRVPPLGHSSKGHGWRLAEARSQGQRGLGPGLPQPPVHLRSETAEVSLRPARLSPSFGCQLNACLPSALAVEFAIVPSLPSSYSCSSSSLPLS